MHFRKFSRFHVAFVLFHIEFRVFWKEKKEKEKGSLEVQNRLGRDTANFQVWVTTENSLSR